MKETWCEKHPGTGSIIIAIVHRIKTISEVHGIYEIEIDKVIYQKPAKPTDYIWKPGDITAVSTEDLKSPKETIKFMFEKL